MMLRFVISLLSLLLAAALALLALRLRRQSAVAAAALVGRWRMSGGSAERVRFEEGGVGYFEGGGTIETFSFRIVCRRLVIERNCHKIRYRIESLPDGTLRLTNGSERLTLMR